MEKTRLCNFDSQCRENRRGNPLKIPLGQHCGVPRENPSENNVQRKPSSSQRIVTFATHHVAYKQAHK